MILYYIVLYYIIYIYSIYTVYIYIYIYSTYMSSEAHDFSLGDERKKIWQYLAIDVLILHRG